jgi:expansin (peptidoglycan-binding protein)|tara:strand:+ start:646 stop:1095 length:450 start_codon:yes stop_codon:yes gene_type:complete
MADLVTTITETVTLNGAVRGSSNVLTTTGVVDVFERILTCAHSNTTTVAVFNSTPHGAAGALDVENCKYFRISNLSTDQDVIVAFVTTNTNYQVTVRAGGSHVLFQAENVAIAEEDTTPAFPTLEDLVTVQVRPSATTDVQVEIFAGLV